MCPKLLIASMNQWQQDYLCHLYRVLYCMLVALLAQLVHYTY